MTNLVTLSCLLVCLAACGVAESRLVPSMPLPWALSIPLKNVTQPKSAGDQVDSTHSDVQNISPREFTIPWGDLALAARVDGLGGAATILNYPPEWRGRMRLVRYDGAQGNDEQPFSPIICERVKVIAKGAYGWFIRSAYRSWISFDIPVFLPNSFLTLAQDVARSFGINYLAYPVIQNGLDEAGGFIELKLGDNAISNHVGRFDILRDALNFNIYGIENAALLRRRVLVNAGDLICDLISGQATVSMVYPIVGEDRTIRLTYDPLTVELQSAY